MLYAAACFWLILCVLLAWGTHQTWCGILKPQTVHAALLPATLVAQMGYIVALLITGGTQRKDLQGEDAGLESHLAPKMPLLGPIIAALLPLAALASMIAIACRRLGMPVLEQVPFDQAAQELPHDLHAFWDQLRGLITLAEGTLFAIRAAEMEDAHRLAFAYLMLCMTIRLAPWAGNIRGYISGIVALCGIAWLASSVSERPAAIFQQVWPLLGLTLGWLLLCFMLTLLVRALVTTCMLLFVADEE